VHSISGETTAQHVLQLSEFSKLWTDSDAMLRPHVFTGFVFASELSSCKVCLIIGPSRLKMSNSLLKSLMFLK